MKWILVIIAVVLTVCGFGVAGANSEQPWEERLRRDLPLLGHRNWIVIADAAYPWQTASGVETVVIEEEQLSVIESVFSALEKTTHVKPTIYLDKELEYVAEADAPGITQYRTSLKKLMGTRSFKAELHEDIIKRLDAAGQTFHVLLLKTRHTQPYTSVFLQLECGYWNEAAEKKLRDALQSSSAKAGN